MNEDAEKALREVLDRDAVPTKPLDEFVAACMAVHRGRWASFVEWLSAPRRAVVSTVAGSLMITSILVLGILTARFDRQEAQPIRPPMQIAMGLTLNGDGDYEF